MILLQMRRSSVSKRDEKVRLYRQVFNTELGREVLADMLEELGFFEQTNDGDSASVARLNFARRLMVLVGWTFRTAEGRLELVEQLMAAEPEWEEQLAPTGAEGK